MLGLLLAGNSRGKTIHCYIINIYFNFVKRLSPIFKSPQVDLGYDVADFYTIQPEYGTMKDFDDLMAKAKELDIKLMLGKTSRLFQIKLIKL